MTTTCTSRPATDALRRALGRFAVAALLAVVAVVLASRVAEAATMAPAEEQLTARINDERRAAGLAPLVVNTQMTGVARGWSTTMASSNRLFHNPNVATEIAKPWTRLGENVGYTQYQGQTVAQLVERLHQAFMASPGHRANVLGDYNQVGVGAVLTADETLWMTINFSLAPLPANGQIVEAAAVSREVFATTGQEGRAAEYVVLGRSDVFADALGGAGLAGDRGPMLFTPGSSPADANPVLHPATRAEIDRVLGGRGTVYLLGGTSAVSQRVADELAADGYDVRRLAGASRVETSVAVAREAIARRGNTGEVLVARADDWADAVTGGAYAAATASPVVLTTREALHPATAAFLSDARPSTRWALGGGAALSDETVRAAGAERVAGADRSATAVAIAERIWKRTAAHAGDHFAATPGWTGDGWAYALAAAPWSAAHDGPALLVGDQVPPATADYLARLGYRPDQPGVVRSASVVTPAVDATLRTLVGG